MKELNAILRFIVLPVLLQQVKTPNKYQSMLSILY